MTAGNCLVTGGSGFVGHYVVSHLVKKNVDVTILSRHSTNGFKCLLGDLSAPEVDLKGRAFTTVYHVAGMAHRVPRTHMEGQKFFQVNAEGTKHLLGALERTGQLPEAVVLISTIAVYGVAEGVLIDEEAPRKATEPYGASKREAEDALMEWAAHRGVRAAIVRLPLVAGRSAPGNLGAMIAALKNGRYLGVGTGAARRSMVMAEDIAKILPLVAHAGGVFNLTDGYHPSFAELEQALCLSLRRKPPKRLPLSLAKVGSRLGDAIQKVSGVNMPLTSRTIMKMTSTLTMSDQRARKMLGWSPSFVLGRAHELVDA